MTDQDDEGDDTILFDPTTAHFQDWSCPVVPSSHKKDVRTNAIVVTPITTKRESSPPVIEPEKLKKKPKKKKRKNKPANNTSYLQPKQTDDAKASSSSVITATASSLSIKKRRRRKPVSKMPDVLKKYITASTSVSSFQQNNKLVWTEQQRKRNMHISRRLRQIVDAACCHPLHLLHSMNLTLQHWIDYAKHIDDQEFGDIDYVERIMDIDRLQSCVFIFPQIQMIQWLALFLRRALAATKTTVVGAFVYTETGLTELFLRREQVIVNMVPGPRSVRDDVPRAFKRYDFLADSVGEPKVMYQEWNDNLCLHVFSHCIVSYKPDVLFIAGSFHALHALCDLNRLLLSEKYGYKRQIYLLKTATSTLTKYDVAQASAVLLVYCAKNIDETKVWVEDNVIESPVEALRFHIARHAMFEEAPQWWLSVIGQVPTSMEMLRHFNVKNRMCCQRLIECFSGHLFLTEKEEKARDDFEASVLKVKDNCCRYKSGGGSCKKFVSSSDDEDEDYEDDICSCSECECNRDWDNEEESDDEDVPTPPPKGKANAK